jgi:hypothetical protein
MAWNPRRIKERAYLQPSPRYVVSCRASRARPFVVLS